MLDLGLMIFYLCGCCPPMAVFHNNFHTDTTAAHFKILNEFVFVPQEDMKLAKVSVIVRLLGSRGKS